MENLCSAKMLAVSGFCGAHYSDYYDARVSQPNDEADGDAALMASVELRYTSSPP